MELFNSVFLPILILIFGLAALVIIGVILEVIRLGLINLVKKLIAKLREIKMTGKWVFISVLVIAAIVAGLYVFDWFVWRPAGIREHCANLAKEEMKTVKGTNNYYRQCVAKNGLKPESLYIIGN